MSEIDRVFRALGDENRLAIVECLSKCPDGCSEEAWTGRTAGEVCCEVTGCQSINSTISHHLKELEHAGVVRVTPQGRYRMFRLNDHLLKEAADFLTRLSEGGKA